MFVNNYFYNFMTCGSVVTLYLWRLCTCGDSIPVVTETYLEEIDHSETQ